MLLCELDLNGDGVSSGSCRYRRLFGEWIKRCPNKVVLFKAGPNKMLLCELDLNGDGVIEMSELLQVSASLPGVDKEVHEQKHVFSPPFSPSAPSCKKSKMRARIMSSLLCFCFLSSSHSDM